MSRAAAALTALVVLLGGAALASEPADPVEARAFEIQFRSLAEASELVTPLLSADGSVTLQPRLGILTVQDRRSVLERIDALLEFRRRPAERRGHRLALPRDRLPRCRGGAGGGRGGPLAGGSRRERDAR